MIPSAINTDCGPVGVLICYDFEFPERARHLPVSFRTEGRQSFLRLRYYHHARAAENQCYVVVIVNVDNLPGASHLDIQFEQSYAQPCDFPLARHGISADTKPNAETAPFSGLIPSLQRMALNSGKVENARDTRRN